MELKKVPSGAFARPTAWPSTTNILETLNLGFLKGDEAVANSAIRSTEHSIALESWGHAEQALLDGDISMLAISHEFLSQAPMIKRELWRHPATFALMVLASPDRLGMDAYWGLRPGTAVVTSPLSKDLLDVHVRGAAAFLQRSRAANNQRYRFRAL